MRKHTYNKNRKKRRPKTLRSSKHRNRSSKSTHHKSRKSSNHKHKSATTSRKKLSSSIPKIFDTHFITFGNKTYYKSVERITNEAKTTGLFSRIIGYTDNDLKNDHEFWRRHGTFIDNTTLGYGCWLWKPYLVLKTLSNMQDGQLLLYADAGCHFNTSALTRLNEYFKLTANSPHGILSFQMSHTALNDKKYTKADVIHHLDIKQTTVESGQLVGGIFVIRKCSETMKIVNLWYETCCQYHLLDNSPSRMTNDATFIGHRNDQSIWSVIRKKYGTELLEDETYSEPNFNPNHPIWATRWKH